MIRRKWGLNDLLDDHTYTDGAHIAKNRKDHRHHMIDAAVINVTDRALLKRISDASGRDGLEGAEKIRVPLPWPAFRTDLETLLGQVIVSHRANHGRIQNGKTAGKLHNDTAYGLTGQTTAKGVPIVVRRKLLTDFKAPADFADVVDETLRAALYSYTQGLEGKAFTEALVEFSRKGKGPAQFQNIRRVRIHEHVSVIPIRDRSGRAYKAYKGDSNHRVDIWQMPDGKWRDEVVSVFDAHQKDDVSKIRSTCPTAKKILSLQINDCLALNTESGRRLVRVVQITSGKVILADLHEAGKFRDRHKDNTDPFRYLFAAPSALKAMQARQVRIDEIGRLFDPGPRPGPKNKNADWA